MTHTLEDYYKQRYLPLRLIGCRPGTLEQYAVSLHHWKSFCPEVLPLGQINTMTLAKFASALTAGRQPATVNKTLRHLRAILRLARREGAIRHMPRIPHLREPRRTPVAFLKEEFGAILQAVIVLGGDYNGVPRSAWWRSFLLSDWDTGLRAGALLQTLTCDVRLDGIPGLYIQPEFQKTWTGGWYAIHPETVEAIGHIYDPGRKQLWPWPFGIKVLPKHFRKICEAAGIICPKRTGCLLQRLHRTEEKTVAPRVFSQLSPTA